MLIPSSEFVDRISIRNTDWSTESPPLVDTELSYSDNHVKKKKIFRRIRRKQSYMFYPFYINSTSVSDADLGKACSSEAGNHHTNIHQRSVSQEF